MSSKKREQSRAVITSEMLHQGRSSISTAALFQEGITQLFSTFWTYLFPSGSPEDDFGSHCPSFYRDMKSVTVTLKFLLFIIIILSQAYFMSKFSICSQGCFLNSSADMSSGSTALKGIFHCKVLTIISLIDMWIIIFYSSMMLNHESPELD